MVNQNVRRNIAVSVLLSPAPLPRREPGTVRPTITVASARLGGRVVLAAAEGPAYAVAEGGDLHQGAAEGGGHGGGKRGGVGGDLLDVRGDRVDPVDLGLRGADRRGGVAEQRDGLSVTSATSWWSP